MKRYLEEIFGLRVKIEHWDGIRKLPLYLRNKREYFVLSIGDIQRVLMKNTSDNFSVSGFEKEMQEIEKLSGIPVILWLDAISTYQRNALIKGRTSAVAVLLLLGASLLWVIRPVARRHAPRSSS